MPGGVEGAWVWRRGARPWTGRHGGGVKVPTMLQKKRRMRVNTITPPIRRTDQNGFMNLTVSMNGMLGSFHCNPWRKPPIQSDTKNDRPPTSQSQKEALASDCECSRVFSMRGMA